MIRANCYSGGKIVVVKERDSADDIEYDDTGFNITEDGDIVFVWVGEFSLEIFDE